jgi:ribosomal protein S18 acetylase RimI-like enzyme
MVQEESIKMGRNLKTRRGYLRMNPKGTVRRSTNNDGPVTIKLASTEDAATVSAITDAAYSKYIQRLNRKPEPMTVDYKDMISNNSVYLLRIGHHPVGVLVLKYEQNQTLVWSVAVRPEYQRRGLGLRLLNYAEQEARDRGYKSIRLYTNSLFVENIALYKWFGYEETGLEPFLGSTLVHMAKKL